MKLYTSDMIRGLVKRHRRSQAHYRTALAEILEGITSQLERGHSIQLTGWGTFYTRLQPSTHIKHIRTGKPITVPAHQVAAFRSGTTLKHGVHKKRIQPRVRAKRTTRKGPTPRK
jgi:DNA-binding protein HU-beta